MIPFEDELRALGLPAGEYVVFAGSALAAHGIREATDLDILVSDTLFDDLLSRYPDSVDEDNTDLLAIGNVELSRRFPKTEGLIAEADIVDGYPVARLEAVMAWKRKKGRPKDIRDIGLIEAFLDRPKE